MAGAAAEDHSQVATMTWTQILAKLNELPDNRRILNGNDSDVVVTHPVE
jgi:hypothetical protein